MRRRWFARQRLLRVAMIMMSSDHDDCDDDAWENWQFQRNRKRKRRRLNRFSCYKTSIYFFAFFIWINGRRGSMLFFMQKWVFVDGLEPCSDYQESESESSGAQPSIVTKRDAVSSERTMITSVSLKSSLKPRRKVDHDRSMKLDELRVNLELMVRLLLR